MINLKTMSIGLVAAAAWAGVALGDGKQLAEPCFECHGENGYSEDGMIPTLGGQSAFVMSDWMFIFADELRPCEVDHPQGSDEAGQMVNHCETMAELSEDEREAIAGYFASLPFKTVEQETTPELVAAGKQVHDLQCEKCHTEGGSLAEDDAGVLAGQSMPYLRKAMKDFMNGDREMPGKMVPKVEALTQDDMEALVHFYGSQGGSD